MVANGGTVVDNDGDENVLPLLVCAMMNDEDDNNDYKCLHYLTMA